MRNRLAFRLRRWATVLDGRSTVDIPGDAAVTIAVDTGQVTITATKPGLDGVNYFRGSAGPVVGYAAHRGGAAGGAGPAPRRCTCSVQSPGSLLGHRRWEFGPHHEDYCAMHRKLSGPSGTVDA